MTTTWHGGIYDMTPPDQIVNLTKLDDNLMFHNNTLSVGRVFFSYFIIEFSITHTKYTNKFTRD